MAVVRISSTYWAMVDGLDGSRTGTSKMTQWHVDVAVMMTSSGFMLWKRGVTIVKSSFCGGESLSAVGLVTGSLISVSV